MRTESDRKDFLRQHARLLGGRFEEVGERRIEISAAGKICPLAFLGGFPPQPERRIRNTPRVLQARNRSTGSMNLLELFGNHIVFIITEKSPYQARGPYQHNAQA